jgi:tetratricopeptide (TPR) repeat protein
MRTNILIAIGLAVITAAVYYHVYDHKFLNYDDQDLYENPQVKAGLTPGTALWAFTATEHANWFPLTRLAWLADWQAFRDWAGGHHLVSVALHTAGGIVLFLVLTWMTGRRWPSAVVAALFLVHPLHVESVAWVIEIKDTLSGLFWMLTLAAYAWYVRRPSLGRYALVALMFALGLAAKPMLVTLPLVLLLLDVWPLGRLGLGGKPSALSADKKRAKSAAMPVKGRGAPPSGAAAAGLGWLVIEKLPLLALAALSSIITVQVQRASNALPPTSVFPMGGRFASATVGYAEYLRKMVWPSDLAAYYPYNFDLPGWEVATAAAVLVALTALVLVAARRRPYLPVGWFWYVGTLVPVIGLVQVGPQAMADRYAYIPLIGIFMAIVWGLADLTAGRRWRGPVLATVAVAAVGGCMVLASRQVDTWADSITLFTQDLGATCDNELARYSRGMAYAALADQAEPAAHAELLDRAITDLGRATEIKDGYIDAEDRLALALVTRGKPGDVKEAIKQFDRAAAARPDAFEMPYRFAMALARGGSMEAAERYFREAVRIKPDLAELRFNLAVALTNLHKNDEAIREYRETIRLDPPFVRAHFGLGVTLTAVGQPNEAIRAYREALRIKPDYADARTNLNALLAQRPGATEIPGTP